MFSGFEKMRDLEGRDQVRMGVQSEIPREREAPRSSEPRSISACTSEGSALAAGLRMGFGSSKRQWGSAGSLAATRGEAPGSASPYVRGWTAYPGLWSENRSGGVQFPDTGTSMGFRAQRPETQGCVHVGAHQTSPGTWRRELEDPVSSSGEGH